MVERKPKTTVEQVQNDSKFQQSSAGSSSRAGKGTSTSEQAHHDEATQAYKQVRHSFTEWLKTNYPGHEHAFIGGVLGFVVALLIFVIGFWATFLIVVFVVIGIAVGQYFDGDPKIVRAIHRLFEGSRN